MKKPFDLGSLPPTVGAAELHILRVFYQTQIWRRNTQLDPCEYGWERHNSKLSPIKRIRNPAAQNFIVTTLSLFSATARRDVVPLAVAKKLD